MASARELLHRQWFTRGRKFRVVQEGARIVGWKPDGPGCQRGFALDLHVGDVLTCMGSSMTSGDGVPAMKWADKDGQWICNEALFEPVEGGMWSGQIPKPGYLEPIE